MPAGVTLVEGDLADTVALGRALEGADAVMHFAGLLSVGQSVKDPASYYHVNVAKGLTLLEAMGLSGVRRIVFSSTCAVQGARVPWTRTIPGSDQPVGASKLTFERALLDFSRAGHLRAVALRYFNAAGCHPDGSLGEDHDPEEHLIPLAIDAVLGRRGALTIHGDDYATPDGTCVRDYIHVQELGRAHLLALSAVDSNEPFQAYNLGTGTGFSVKQVIDAVGRAAGQPVPARVGPRRAGDPPELVAAPARARDRLGFATAMGLDVIVDSAFRWRQNHPRGYGSSS